MQSADGHQPQMRHQPSSMQDLVGGKKNGMLKNKLRDVADIVKEPSQADKDRSALVLAHATFGHGHHHGAQTIIPAARLSYLNPDNIGRPYQITSPAPEVEPEPRSSGKAINTFLAEYAETISSDSEIEEIRYDTLPRTGISLVTSDVPLSGADTGKKRLSAQANEWSSGDSDDEKDEDYTPSARKTTTAFPEERVARDAHTGRPREKYWVQKQQKTLSVRREADRARRGEKHELDAEPTQERPSKIVKLNLSPKSQAAAKTPSTVGKNTISRPNFPKGKRVVKKDGYSQTRKTEPASTHASVSTDFTTANAVDYRARIAYQKEMEDEFRKSLDQDIVQQVEAEGWITPAGRLFKAGIRQMQRVTQEREAVEAADHRTMELNFEGQQRKIQRLESENEKLRGGVEQVRQVLDKLDLGE